MPLNKQNIYGTQPSPLDFTDKNKPATRSKTYHGFGIVVNGRFVASIQSWSTTGYQRNLTPVKELSPATFGRNVDIIPGVAGDTSISLNRVEIWEDELEIALGLSAQEWVDLLDQNTPFTIMEVLYKGKSLYRMWEYKGCWFSDKNVESFSSDGDGKFSISGSISYVTKRLAYGV